MYLVTKISSKFDHFSKAIVLAISRKLGYSSLGFCAHRHGCWCFKIDLTQFPTYLNVVDFVSSKENFLKIWSFFQGYSLSHFPKIRLFFFGIWPHRYGCRCLKIDFTLFPTYLSVVDLVFSNKNFLKVWSFLQGYSLSSFSKNKAILFWVFGRIDMIPDFLRLI